MKAQLIGIVSSTLESGDQVILMSRVVQDLLRGFPDDCRRLCRYRDNLKSFQALRWDEAWNKIVKPLFDDS